MNIAQITQLQADDLALPNERFAQPTEALVTYNHQTWELTIVPAERPRFEQFPPAGYQLAAIDQKGFALGAYDETHTCVGLAIFEKYDANTLYLVDLNVQQAVRRQGVARQLLDFAQKKAQDLGLTRLQTTAQQTNGPACQFYQNYGFQVGGYDTRHYDGTSQAGKHDITFYLSFT